jgi:DNA-directed RNA polymerase specialized sigma subunit
LSDGINVSNVYRTTTKKENIMRKNVYEPLSKEQLNDLVFSFADKVHSVCLKKVREMHCIDNYNDEQKEMVHDLEQICFEVLMKKAETYNPNHKSGENLSTYDSAEIKNAILQKTNKGMTSTEIRQYNRIREGIEYYEEKFNTPWYETENSLNKLSDITGYSVKVIKKTLAIKRDTNIETISLSAPIGNEEDLIVEDTLGNDYYSFETELRNNEARLFIESLSKLEKDILFTMVDTEHDYKPISEREGVRLLEEKGYTKENGYSLGRGTLNNYRETLKRKVYSFLNDPDYVIAA